MHIDADSFLLQTQANFMAQTILILLILNTSSLIIYSSRQSMEHFAKVIRRKFISVKEKCKMNGI